MPENMKEVTMPPDVQWVACDSTNLGRYGYSPSRQALIVEFINRQREPVATWQYAGPEAQSMYEQMKDAESVGGFFRSNVRNNENLKASEVKPS